MIFLAALFLLPMLWATPPAAVRLTINNSTNSKTALKVSLKCLKGPERQSLAPGATVVSEWSIDPDAKCKNPALTLTLLEQDFQWEGEIDDHGTVHFRFSIAGSSKDRVEVVSIESHELTGTSSVELKIHP
jgi:hypothetical protein